MSSGCKTVSQFSFDELSSSEFIIRAVIVAIIAYVVISIMTGNMKWVSDNVDMMYEMKSKMLIQVCWVIFFIVFTYCWYKVSSMIECNRSRQLVDLFFGGVAVMIVCWVVGLYYGHNFTTSKRFISGAAGLMIITTLYLWSLNSVVSIGLAVATLWLMYQSAVALTMKPKETETED